MKFSLLVLLIFTPLHIMSKNKYSSEKLAQYEKQNQCIEDGALIISAGIIAGTIMSTIFVNPIPIYVGTALGNFIAIGNCYSYFRTKSTASTSRNQSNTSYDVCDFVYENKDDNRTILDKCRRLPSITEFGKNCIERKEKEEKEKKKGEDDRKPCKGTLSEVERFSKPKGSCTKGACLKRDASSEKESTVEKKSPATEKEENKPPDNRMKRFTNPKKNSDYMTQDEATKESYKTHPLKRFTNSKKVIPSETVDEPGKK